MELTGKLRTESGQNRAGLSAAFCALAFAAYCAALLFYPNQVRDSTLQSILYCLTVLTPSLFPFMALTSFAVNSGANEVIGRLLGGISKYVFRLPKACTATIFLSFIGGYPAGARGVSLLLEEGAVDREQAGRMLLFCVNPGIAFVVTFLGGTILGSFAAGWMLFFSVCIAGILLGFLTGLRAKLPKEAPRAEAGKSRQGALIRCATDASSSVVKMCACVVLFSGFTAILHGSGLFGLLTHALSLPQIFTPMECASLLSFFIEVTGGAGDAAALGVGPAFFAFGLAFGGLCIHLQVFSFFRDAPVKKGKFLLFRFLHGLLAALVYLGLSRLFPRATATLASAPAGAALGGLGMTAAGGISLLLLCAAFLLIATKGREDCGNDKKLL